MSPLPADQGLFVARPRPAAPATPASGGLVPPLVAGASGGDARETAPLRQESPLPSASGSSAEAAPDELPWLSESVTALAGLVSFDEELIAPPAPDTAAEPVAVEVELEPAEEWDDELGTFPLSEELPEPAPEGEHAAGDEGAWPNYTLPIVTEPVPSAAVERVAQRLERIARTLRERGPTGPLEEDSSDPLGALITGYVLGLAGAEKNRD